MSTGERYIRPWKEVHPWYDSRSRLNSSPRQPEIKGTEVKYRGEVLRARGEYRDRLARALIASLNHMQSEGYTQT